jgi:hypothetical protein
MRRGHGNGHRRLFAALDRAFQAERSKLRRDGRYVFYVHEKLLN